MVRKWQVLVSSSSPVFNNNTPYLKYYLDCAVPVFTRPAPTTCSSSIASTCTSDDNTPPLLLFNRSRSSISGGYNIPIHTHRMWAPFDIETLPRLLAIALCEFLHHSIVIRCIVARYMADLYLISLYCIIVNRILTFSVIPRCSHILNKA